jgi:hypothetical protein
MLPAKGGEWQPLASAPFDRDLELAVIADGAPQISEQPVNWRDRRLKSYYVLRRGNT